jgi:hypothetical protein
VDGGEAGAGVAAETRLVWSDEGVSMEERRAVQAKYTAGGGTQGTAVDEKIDHRLSLVLAAV